ncbi:hypothetical protein BLOT_005196, partial [Blomia tropicalis]
MDENFLSQLCQLFEFEEFIDYFNAHKFNDVNDFLKNGLENFKFYSPNPKRAIDFINTMKKYQQRTNIIKPEEVINFCPVSIDVPNQAEVVDLVSRLFNLENEVASLKVNMEKILKTVSKEDRANGKIIIDLDLGWVIEEDDLFAIAHDQSNHDLANLLDKICGRRLFVEYSSFDKLDSNVKEALEKIGMHYVKAKLKHGGNQKKLKSETMSRIKKRFNNLKSRSKKRVNPDQNHNESIGATLPLECINQ